MALKNNFRIFLSAGWWRAVAYSLWRGWCWSLCWWWSSCENWHSPQRRNRKEPPCSHHDAFVQNSCKPQGSRKAIRVWQLIWERRDEICHVESTFTERVAVCNRGRPCLSGSRRKDFGQRNCADWGEIWDLSYCMAAVWTFPACLPVKGSCI